MGINDPKNFGPGVLTVQDPTFRNFVQLVFQQGKPPLDSEWNLQQEVESGRATDLVKRLMPSGFISDVPFTFYNDKANRFDMVAEGSRQELHVNVAGYIFRIRGTNTADDFANLINLPQAPVTGKRTEFIFLEVWQALLSPDPSTDNKPAADKVYKFGNVNYQGEQLEEEMIVEPEPGVETSLRVQLQYRLRIVSDVDNVNNPDGFSDSKVTAQGPLENPGATTYINMGPALNDYGLWAAEYSEDSPIVTDGTIYAIPIAFVHRRNTETFSLLNQNGANRVIGQDSDRPDELFNNEVNSIDIEDLRHQVFVQRDWSDILEENLDCLLANELKTKIAYNPLSGASGGNVVLQADAVATNIVDGAVLIGRADDFRTVWSESEILEQEKFKLFTVNDKIVGNNGGVWSIGDKVGLNLISTPAGSQIIQDSIKVFSEETGEDLDITLNAINALNIQIELRSIPSVLGGSLRNLWVYFDILYVPDEGLTHISEKLLSGRYPNVSDNAKGDILSRLDRMISENITQKYAPQETRGLILNVAFDDELDKYVDVPEDLDRPDESSIYATNQTSDDIREARKDSMIVLDEPYMNEDMASNPSRKAVRIQPIFRTIDPVNSARLLLTGAIRRDGDDLYVKVPVQIDYLRGIYTESLGGDEIIGKTAGPVVPLKDPTIDDGNVLSLFNTHVLEVTSVTIAGLQFIGPNFTSARRFYPVLLRTQGTISRFLLADTDGNILDLSDIEESDILVTYRYYDSTYDIGDTEFLVPEENKNQVETHIAEGRSFFVDADVRVAPHSQAIVQIFYNYVPQNQEDFGDGLSTGDNEQFRFLTCKNDILVTTGAFQSGPGLVSNRYDPILGKIPEPPDLGSFTLARLAIDLGNDFGNLDSAFIKLPIITSINGRDFQSLFDGTFELNDKIADNTYKKLVQNGLVQDVKTFSFSSVEEQEKIVFIAGLITNEKGEVHLILFSQVISSKQNGIQLDLVDKNAIGVYKIKGKILIKNVLV